jgi:CMP-N-acetylneuraminic acid synthetase
MFNRGEGWAIMIVSLLTGRKGSKGFPNKHFCKVGGRELASYPMGVSVGCRDIDKRYISTDDERLMGMAKEFNMEVIERPSYLASDDATSVDVFVHAYDIIKGLNKDSAIEIIVLLMCNAPMVTSAIVSDGIDILRKNPEYDSAVTVSRYNMWSPLRARRIGEDGLLSPFIEHEKLGNVVNFSCDRDSQGDVWFADMGVSVVRARCIDNIENGILPQQWMGQKIFPLRQEGGLDVDYEMQMPYVENWLKLYGE